jgi:hypothetical protein
MFPTSIIVHRVKWKGTFWAAGDETSSDFTDELLDHYDMAIHFGQVQYMYILRAGAILSYNCKTCHRE